MIFPFLLMNFDFKYLQNDSSELNQIFCRVEGVQYLLKYFFEIRKKYPPLPLLAAEIIAEF